ncbi:3-hydroxybutyrate dehydrogenase [Actinomadura sp. 21ATH]|uniref:3-hydroxybutyrate dehydrogenase n=1 Tax=Actinomadura sp. 21ATH TaxID=1735444 RepID=UPI0035C1729F
MTPDLTGRRALVTGGGRGIGRACARRLAAYGAKVVVADIDGRAAARAAGECGGTAVTADLAELPSLEELGGAVDILVNNAGVQHVAPLHEFPPGTFAHMMRLMVEAPFRLVREALPGMYEQGWGRVVNISSVHGLRASPYKAAYVAAKHALEGLSKVVALEGGPHGVTSNCVCPAYVRTPLVEGQIDDQARVHGLSPEQVTSDVLLAKAAVKRLIDPDDVAGLVAYLCTPQAAMVTGASLSLDGGWTAQ